MNEVSICNKCGIEFIPDKSLLKEMQKDDLRVQYFICPECGERYHVFTSDSEMRALIEQRRTVQIKIRAAFAKKFREKVIREYERELDQIKQKQESIWPRLKKLGEEIIRSAVEP